MKRIPRTIEGWIVGLFMVGILIMGIGIIYVYNWLVHQ
jgi:hypothetical protein